MRCRELFLMNVLTFSMALPRNLLHDSVFALHNFRKGLKRLLSGFRLWPTTRKKCIEIGTKNLVSYFRSSEVLFRSMHAIDDNITFTRKVSTRRNFQNIFPK